MSSLKTIEYVVIVLWIASLFCFLINTSVYNLKGVETDIMNVELLLASSLLFGIVINYPKETQAEANPLIIPESWVATLTMILGATPILISLSWLLEWKTLNISNLTILCTTEFLIYIVSIYAYLRHKKNTKNLALKSEHFLLIFRISIFNYG